MKSIAAGTSLNLGAKIAGPKGGDKSRGQLNSRMCKIVEARFGQGKVGQKHVEEGTANWTRNSISDTVGWIIQHLVTVHYGLKDGALSIVKLDEAPLAGEVGALERVPQGGRAHGPPRVVRARCHCAGGGWCPRGAVERNGRPGTQGDGWILSADGCAEQTSPDSGCDMEHLAFAWGLALGPDHARKRGALRGLAESHDVLALQETRGTAAYMHTLPAPHRYWGTSDAHHDASVATARGGTLLGIARRLTDVAIDIRHEVLQQARATGVKIELQGAKLVSASVHVDPARNLPAKTRWFHTLRRWLDSSADRFAMLLGTGDSFPPTRSGCQAWGGRHPLPIERRSASNTCWRTLQSCISHTIPGADVARTACHWA